MTGFFLIAAAIAGQSFAELAKGKAMACHDPNLEIFAQRVKRINSCASNTASTLYVGMDLSFDRAAIRKKAKPAKKGRGWLFLALSAPLVAFGLVTLHNSGVDLGAVLADPITPLFSIARTAMAYAGLPGII